MSLLSTDKTCYVCGTTYGLHKHHIFGGTGRRKLSDQDGLWVWLCGPHHNLSNEGVHFNKDLMDRLHREGQAAWECVFGDRAAFIKRYGRNYL